MIPLYSLRTEIILVSIGISIFLIFQFIYLKYHKKFLEKYKNKRYEKINKEFHGKNLQAESFSLMHKLMHDIDDKVNSSLDTLKNSRLSLIIYNSILIVDILITRIMPEKYMPQNIDFHNLLLFTLILVTSSFFVYSYQLISNEVTLRRDIK